MTTKDIKYNRVLIINPFGIGDVLFTTPIARAIKDNFPNSYIGYLCNRRAKGILENNPTIDILYVYEKDEYRAEYSRSKLKCFKKFLALLKSIKTDKYDLVIDLSLGRAYNFFSWIIGIKKRVGFNYKNRGMFLTDKINIDGYKKKHVVEFYLDLLKFLTIDYNNNQLELYSLKRDIDWADKFLKDNNVSVNDILIGITPGGGASWGKEAQYLHWSEERFARVADQLIKNYKVKVIIFGDNKDIDLCSEVSRLMKYRPIIAFGKTNLKQFCALLKKCKVLICNDTGPLHVAVAAKIKTVCIAGPVDEKVYGPYPKTDEHIVVKKILLCRPCYQKFRMPHCEFDKKCLNVITVADVYRAVERLL